MATIRRILGQIWTFLRAMTTSDKINLVGIIVGIVANAISLGSNSIARQANLISQQLYYESTTPIWTATVDNESDDMVLNSLNSNIYLQDARIYYPVKILDTTWDVDLPDYKFSIMLFKSGLSEYVKDNILVVEGTYKIVEDYIPIIIESNYAVDGLSRTDKGLYYLSYQTLVSEDKTPNIKIKGLVFQTHIEMSKDNNIINNLLEERLYEINKR